MSFEQNQFELSKGKGALDIGSNQHAIISCQLDPDGAASDVPVGSAVTLKDVAGSPIIVDDASGQTDIFGFIFLQRKKNLYDAGDFVEIATDGAVMVMEASEAIARGDKVEYVVAGEKVATSSTEANYIGTALDKSTADGDLIRVKIKTIK